MSDWISVNDQLPEEDVHVLAWIEDDGAEWAEVCSQHNSFFTSWDHEPLPVTHWMELPEPPK